jgi:hypothetical protein
MLLDLVEDVVTGLAEGDELERRREELARAWAESAATLDADATVLVAPAPVRRLGQLSYAIVAHERRPPADLPEIAELDLNPVLVGADGAQMHGRARARGAAGPGPAGGRPAPPAPGGTSSRRQCRLLCGW